MSRPRPWSWSAAATTVVVIVFSFNPSESGDVGGVGLVSGAVTVLAGAGRGRGKRSSRDRDTGANAWATAGSGSGGGGEEGRSIKEKKRKTNRENPLTRSVRCTGCTVVRVPDECETGLTRAPRLSRRRRAERLVPRLATGGACVRVRVSVCGARVRRTPCCGLTWQMNARRQWSGRGRPTEHVRARPDRRRRDAAGAITTLRRRAHARQPHTVPRRLVRLLARPSAAGATPARHRAVHRSVRTRFRRSACSA